MDNIIPELIALLTLSIVGFVFFGRFEVETPAWRRLLKWSFTILVTLGLYTKIGHYALIALGTWIMIGLVFHFIWCARNGIHPLWATPRKKYYELRGWKE